MSLNEEKEKNCEFLLVKKKNNKIKKKIIIIIITLLQYISLKKNQKLIQFRLHFLLL